MSWNSFILMVSAVYLLYYSILIMYDKLRSPAFLPANGASAQEFDVQDFLADPPVQVTPADVQAPEAPEAPSRPEEKQSPPARATVGGEVVSFGMDLKGLIKAAQQGSIQYTADIQF